MQKVLWEKLYITQVFAVVDDRQLQRVKYSMMHLAVTICCVQQEKPKLFAKDEKIDHKKVDDKLRELVSGRGKKGTDRSRHIESITELRQLAADAGLGEALDCKILFAIVAAIFDYNPNIATSMKSDMWEKCVCTETAFFIYSCLPVAVIMH